MNIIEFTNIRKNILMKTNIENKYKWNITITSVVHFVSVIIYDILKNKYDNVIYINNLSLMINKIFKRKHNFIIKKNGQPKSICNFIKLELGGMDNFINKYLCDICKFVTIDNVKYVRLKSKDQDLIDSWVII